MSELNSTTNPSDSHSRAKNVFDPHLPLRDFLSLARERIEVRVAPCFERFVYLDVDLRSK